jgi:hypothetical protein
MLRFIFRPLVLVFVSTQVYAQDSAWMKMDDSLLSNNVVRSTFKATQIINTPTIEQPGKGGLQFMIMHRFGKINEGGYALFGLDNASIRFGLDYGVTDRLMVGIGRSSFNKVYDGSIKWAALRQKTNGLPFSISLYELLAHTTLRYPDKPFIKGKYRTAYQSSLLIARKFSSAISLQLTPSFVHYNLVPAPVDKNNVLALGIGGRVKLTKRLSINGEYTYTSADQLVSEADYRSLSFGVDLETGGHVFQLVFTNSQGMIGPAFIGRTNGDWGNGDIYFGFNISRYFDLKKDK